MGSFTNPYPASRLTVDSTNSLANGLVGFWPLTDGSGTTAKDISTGANDGVGQGGVNWDSSSIGTVFASDKTTDSYFVSNYSASGQSAISLSFWFIYNFDGDSATGWNGLFRNGDSSNGVLQVYHHKTNNELRFSVGTAGGATGFNTAESGSWTTGAVYHAVFTYDGTTGKVYLNGSEQSSGTHSFPGNIKTLASQPFNIGVAVIPPDSSAAGSTTLDGDIQNVRVYDRALSAAEVATLYYRPWEGTNYGDLWPYSPPAAGSMTLSTDTAATSLLSGMQAWFPLTDGTGTTAQCILHPSHIGTLNGGVSWENGERGVVASFDNAGDFIETNSNSTVTSFPITVSAWVKSGGSSRDVIFGSYWANGTNRSLQCEIDASGRMYMLCSSTGSYQSSNSVRGTTTLSTTEYSHVVFVFEASGGTLYLNGEVESSSGSLFSTLNTPVVNFLIGAEGTASNQSHRFDGNISNVQVWDRAITATEVTTLYHRPWEGIEYGDTFHYDPPAPASMLPLTSDSINTDQELWYPLTDGSSTTAVDISGGGNDATLLSAAGWATSSLGTVLALDGQTNSYATTPLLSSSVSHPHTHSVWFRTSDTSGYIIHQLAGTSGIFLRMNSSTLEAYAGTTVALGSANQFNDNQWHNVVAVFNDTSSAFYVDGVLISSSNPGTRGWAGSTIGARSNGAQILVSDLQNYRVWSRALTADEVWSIYANPWLGSNYKLASGSTPLYNYIFRTERFRRLA